jgi:hypothetical protein
MHSMKHVIFSIIILCIYASRDASVAGGLIF